MRDARIALGRSDELAAELARAQARRLLAEVTLERDDMTLRRRLGAMRVAGILPADIHRWRDDCTGRERAAATVHRRSRGRDIESPLGVSAAAATFAAGQQDRSQDNLAHTKRH